MVVVAEAAVGVLVVVLVVLLSWQVVVVVVTVVLAVVLAGLLLLLVVVAVVVVLLVVLVPCACCSQQSALHHGAADQILKEHGAVLVAGAVFAFAEAARMLECPCLTCCLRLRAPCALWLAQPVPLQAHSLHLEPFCAFCCAVVLCAG